MVLVSYDQTQFTEATRASWTYLTVIGPLLIEGEKNDTRTVMDAVVYDIPRTPCSFAPRARAPSTAGRARSTWTASAGSSPRGVRPRDRDPDRQPGRRADPLRGAGPERHRPGPRTTAIAMYDAKGERITAAGGGGGALGFPS